VTREYPHHEPLLCTGPERAWCWRRLAETLPEGDPRIAPMLDAARTHAEAGLPHATGSDYAVEHWLACYAVLLLA
jgi:Protein of unknown function (DUF2891)